MKFSIIIPVYNEEKTIKEVLAAVKKVALPGDKEVIIIDDGSRDGSRNVIEEYIRKNNSKKTSFTLVTKENGGKGSAIRKGFEKATGDIIMIQDADLEYNPEEYISLVKPIIAKETRVVYGSRFLNDHKPLYKLFYLGNKFLSLTTKVLYRANITDMETCYKVFDARVIKQLPLKANKFDIEPEITAKLLRSGITIKEMPISYAPRTVEEGKKIGWKDGLQALGVLFRLRFFHIPHKYHANPK